ncbi:MAG: hypothetical protein J7L38_08150 [Thermoproteales archaeon]|nr:hypothetical protein [Thermoproteales archaeon]
MKKNYPRNSDLRKAILTVLSSNIFLTPDDFPEEVIKTLERNGFYTGLVNTKRIWRIYEKMVRKGEIYDILDVVTEDKERHRLRKI